MESTTDYVARVQRQLQQKTEGGSEPAPPVPQTGHIDTKREHDISLLMDRVDKLEKAKEAQREHQVNQAAHAYNQHQQSRQQSQTEDQYASGRNAAAHMLQTMRDARNSKPATVRQKFPSSLIKQIQNGPKIYGK